MAQESTLNWMLSLTSDGVDQVLRSILPRDPPRHSPSDIDDISDNELIRLRRDPRFELSSTSFGTHNIRRVTEHTVMKADQGWEADSDYPSEALVLQLVAQQTSIPVPHVRRLVQGKRSNIIAMEHIPGQQLSAVWPTLSWAQRVRIAFIINSYIRQLRNIRHPRSAIPGPLGGPGERGKVCISLLFGQVHGLRGPFETYADLSNFFNDRAAMTLASEARTLKSQGKPPPAIDRLPPFDDSQPLVLTHQDLNPRNFIVGDDGHLWLVDWAWAGFYPPWFEFVAMGIQSENEEQLTCQKNADWDALIPFSCGQFFEQERWLNRMGASLDWF